MEALSRHVCPIQTVSRTTALGAREQRHRRIRMLPARLAAPVSLR